MNNSINSVMSIGEAARLLGVHPETLRNWHKRGLLSPYMTLGGHRRYAKLDIEKLVQRMNKISLSANTQFNTKKRVNKSVFS